MGFVRTLLLLLHVIGLVLLLLISFFQGRRAAPRLSPGLLHGALTLLGSGVALIGVNYLLDRDVNNARATVKTLLLLAILGLVLVNRRRDRVPPGVYAGIGGLTAVTTLLALVWS